jgi:hypothetical protein
MRTSFKREESPKTELQRRSYYANNMAITYPVREATNGKMAWVFEGESLERRNQSLKGESSEGKSQECFGVK